MSTVGGVVGFVAGRLVVVWLRALVGHASGCGRWLSSACLSFAPLSSSGLAVLIVCIVVVAVLYLDVHVCK